VFLGKIKDAFERNPELQNLLLDDFFKSAVDNCQVRGWQWVVLCSLGLSSIDVPEVCPVDRNLSVSRANPAPDLLLSALRTPGGG
jgi:6-phosphogluconate dehydrogenase